MPATRASLSRLFFFGGGALTVLMKQTRQAVRTFKLSIYLDVYGKALRLSGAQVAKTLLHWFMICRATDHILPLVYEKGGSNWQWQTLVLITAIKNLHIFTPTCWNRWICGEFLCFSWIWWSFMIKLYLNFMFISIFLWKTIKFWHKVGLQKVGMKIWTKWPAPSKLF